MGIIIILDDQTNEVSTVSSSKECAFELEYYPGIGVHILINSPTSASGRSEVAELWATSDGLSLVSHTASGNGQDGALILTVEDEAPTDLPDNILTLPIRSLP